MDISQFDYDLPATLIAQYPSEIRSQSRLLKVGKNVGCSQDLSFEDLVGLLNPGDLVVVNDTRVLPARMYGKKPTGAKIEIMLERVVNKTQALVMLGASKSVKVGQRFVVGECSIEVVGRQQPFFLLQFPESDTAVSVFEKYGSVPLPPYIIRDTETLDNVRYQSVYAQVPGAVAAPTAGLHFDQKLIDLIIAHGVDWASITLHVGAGTFQPVRCANVHEHRMHRERVHIENRVCELISRTKSRGGRVFAIGTTVVRALESAVKMGKVKPGVMDTDLFITPGFEFKIVDAMITNFHLPKSTLLMMVCAFAGYQRTMAAYRHAVKNQYRFFSYGDAMLLEKP